MDSLIGDGYYSSYQDSSDPPVYDAGYTNLLTLDWDTVDRIEPNNPRQQVNEVEPGYEVDTANILNAKKSHLSMKKKRLRDVVLDEEVDRRYNTQNDDIATTNMGTEVETRTVEPHNDDIATTDMDDEVNFSHFVDDLDVMEEAYDIGLDGDISSDEEGSEGFDSALEEDSLDENEDDDGTLRAMSYRKRRRLHKFFKKLFIWMK